MSDVDSSGEPLSNLGKDLCKGSVAELQEVMRCLLAEDGCPWDREQTLDSLRKYTIEEAYEVVDAIEREAVEDHCDELGDLLLQIVFQSELRAASGDFDFADVVRSVCDKMVRRHPHVFANAHADTSEQVIENWEIIKAQERALKQASQPRQGETYISPLSGIPRTFPALMKAHRMSEKSAAHGYEFASAQAALRNVKDELEELREVMSVGDESQRRLMLNDELGDVLFSLVNLARSLDIDASDALLTSTEKFRRRFDHVYESASKQGLSLNELNDEAREKLWQTAKTVINKRDSLS